MDILQELQVQLEKARAFLKDHPETDIPLGYRLAIKMALGPYYEVKHNQLQTSAAAGYKRRGVLAILTARYVQPIWQQVVPSESATLEDVKEAEPTHALLKSQRILTGQIAVGSDEWDELNSFYSYLWVKLLRIMETNNVDQTWPVGAGWSALTTLEATQCDLEIDDSDLNLTDDDLEMDEQYYEFYAVIAYANGTPDWPSADRARRQQFWNWWLTEAVPTAWSAVNDDGSFQNTAWQLPVQSDTDGQEPFLYEQMVGHQETTVKIFDGADGHIKQQLPINDTGSPS